MSGLLALMLSHPNFRGGFPTGTLCSMLQTAGIRSENGKRKIPARPTSATVLRELRKLEAAGDVSCLGNRLAVRPDDCWRGNAARNAELLWQPTDAALARVDGAQ